MLLKKACCQLNFNVSLIERYLLTQLCSVVKNMCSVIDEMWYYVHLTDEAQRHKELDQVKH